MLPLKRNIENIREKYKKKDIRKKERENYNIIRL
jgi:hypothetical protein